MWEKEKLLVLQTHTQKKRELVWEGVKAWYEKVMKKFSFSPQLIVKKTKYFYSSKGKKRYQSVENAGVAFVKGANEKNEFFFKINKQ